MKKGILLALSIFISAHLLYAQASFSLAASICKNDTMILTANTGTMANCTFTWFCSPNGGNFSSPNNSTTDLSFTNAGTFSIVLTVSSGSTASSMQNTINALALPAVALVQTSPTTCITNNSPLFSKPVNLIATGGISYTWNPPFTTMIGNPNGPLNTVRPASNTCFSVTGIDANGCKAMTSICVTVIPRFSITVTPSISLICWNGFGGPDAYVELVAGNPSAPAFGLAPSHTYSWTGAGILSPPFSATVEAAPFTTITYTAEIRDSLSCVSLPALATVSVQNCTGVAENSSALFDINFFPNPVKETLTIQIPENLGDIRINIINALGVSVISANQIQKEIDVCSLSKGIYLIRATKGNMNKTFKIIKD